MKNIVLYISILLAFSACASPEPPPLVSDGGFEKQLEGNLQEPFHIKPDSMPDRFIVTGDEDAFEGSRFLRIRADTAAWFEVSQYVQLLPATKYSASIYIRGDACEVHAGAYCYGSQKFLGWNNDMVPGPDWQEVRFDFVSDSSHAETKIYLDVRHMKEPITVDVDAIRVEIPTVLSMPE